MKYLFSDEFSNRVHEILEQKDAIIQEEKEATLTLKEKLSRIKEEKQKLETDTKEICTGYKDAADNAWLSYAELDAKSKRDSEENEDLRKRCRNITARSDDLNKIIKTSEKEIADLNRRIQLVEQEKESMVATMLRLQSDKNTLEKEGKALKDELYAKQLAVSCVVGAYSHLMLNGLEISMLGFIQDFSTWGGGGGGVQLVSPARSFT